MDTNKPARLQIYKEALVATCVVMILVLLVSFFPFKFEFIKPIKQEFGDFDIYDLYYSGNGNGADDQRDSNIYIVEADTSRANIAQQITWLNSLKPAVIGVDLSFGGPKEPQADSLLKTALGLPAVVTGYRVDPDESDDIMQEEFLGPEAYLAHGGFINFLEADSNAVIRAFQPFFIRGKKRLAFTTAILQRYAPGKYTTLANRNNSVEYINYTGGTDRYVHYTVPEFAELYHKGQLGDMQGKIVLLGVFSQPGDVPRVEDLHFSPLNPKVSGRSFPDLYGVVIHANILTMMLEPEKYITVPPLWLSFVIGFVCAFFFMLPIIWAHKHFGHPSHLLFLVLQMICIVALVYLFLKLFEWIGLKITLAPVILFLVASFELLEVYKWAAKGLHRLFNYQSIFTTHK